MTRTLLTGGSGFFASHVLDTLLKHGHSVVTTVRTQTKAEKIREAHSKYGKDKLDVVILKDMAQPDAFDEVVVSEPPFEAVIHTASPVHYNAVDTKKDMLDPSMSYLPPVTLNVTRRKPNEIGQLTPSQAINGTTGILKAVKRYAPTVRRVVFTSSFAAMMDTTKTPDHVYSEADWNPITEEEVRENTFNGYRASKIFAERAAWDFMKREMPNFALSTASASSLCSLTHASNTHQCNPALILGHLVHQLSSLNDVNLSNQRIRDLITGASKENIFPTGVFLWIDVRDLALAHVLAIEKRDAANKRFFITAGYFSNKEIAEIIYGAFPDLASKLPVGEALKAGDYPAEKPYKYDNSRAVDVLGLKFRTLKEKCC